MRYAGFPSISEEKRSRYETQAPFRREEAKFGGMEVSDAKRLRELEVENRMLKRLLGEAKLDKAALKELVEGKW